MILAIALDWVRRVYQSGLTDKERKRFDAAKAALRPVVQALRPLHRHGEGESAFRGLFQRVEVLPRGLYNEYDKHLRNKHYLLATQLLVPILLGTFYALNSARRLAALKDGLLMADVYYDYELGLLPNEVDLDAIII